MSAEDVVQIGPVRRGPASSPRRSDTRSAMFDATAPSDGILPLRERLRRGRSAVVGFRVRRAVLRSLPIALALLALAATLRHFGGLSATAIVVLVVAAPSVAIASVLFARWPTRSSERDWTRWWDDATRQPQSVQVAHELLSRSTGWTPWERLTILRADFAPPTSRELAIVRPDRWAPLLWRVALPLTLLAGAIVLFVPTGGASRTEVASDSEASSPRSDRPVADEAENGAPVTRGGDPADRRRDERPRSPAEDRSPVERLRREMATRSFAAARLAPVTELEPLGEWLLGATNAPPAAPARPLSEPELARLREAIALLEQGGETELGRWMERWAEGDGSPPPDIGFGDGDDWRAALAELERVSAAAPSQFRDRNRATGGDDPARSPDAASDDGSRPTPPSSEIDRLNETLRLTPDRIADGGRPIDAPQFDDPSARAAWVDLWSSPEVEPRFLILAHLHARSAASAPPR